MLQPRCNLQPFLAAVCLFRIALHYILLCYCTMLLAVTFLPYGEKRDGVATEIIYCPLK